VRVAAHDMRVVPWWWCDDDTWCNDDSGSCSRGRHRTPPRKAVQSYDVAMRVLAQRITKQRRNPFVFVQCESSILPQSSGQHM
jgi:hypothetical protein